MLPFRNELTNDDPLSDPEMLLGLHHWYMGVVLVTFNLAGLPATIYLYRAGFPFYSAAVAGSIILSMAYHLCQTTGVCFFVPLPIWVLLDHVSAPILCVMTLLFLVNARSTLQMNRQSHENVRLTQLKLDQQKRQRTATKESLLLPVTSHLRRDMRSIRSLQKRNSPRAVSHESSTEDEEESDEDDDSESEEALVRGERFPTERNKSYYDPEEHRSENMVYDGWSSYSTFFGLLIVVCAAVVHPFSMEAFVIVIVFSLLLIFIKICVIDEGYPENMIARISLPELLIGVLFIIVALVVFVLDCYFYYWILHSIWHVLIYLGLYFFSVGMTKNTPYWYSIWQPSSMTCCCSKRAGGHEADQKKFPEPVKQANLTRMRDLPTIKHALPIRRRVLYSRG